MLIFYLLGILVAFLLLRKVVGRPFDLDDMLAIFVASLGSWFTVAIIVFMLILAMSTKM